MGRIDARLLQSSLTLMKSAGGGPVVEEALEAFYGGLPCRRTVEELGLRVPRPRRRKGSARPGLTPRRDGPSEAVPA